MSIVDDVIPAFEELSDDEEIPENFLAYFEATYIGIQRGRGVRRRRAPPMFPIELWNVRTRVDKNKPRTNNGVEAFHNALNKSVLNCHPSIWKLINCLKKEEAMAVTKKLAHERGDSVPKTKYFFLNERLLSLCRKYSSVEKMGFLKVVAHKRNRPKKSH